MKTINVEKITYDVKSGTGSIKIVDTDEGSASLNIDLNTLLSFANLVSKEVLDFFMISATVYGIDRFVKRKENSVDGWSRELQVTFPVHDSLKWNVCKKDFDKLLSFLTGDYWNIEFKEESIELPSKDLSEAYKMSFEQVSLLSGGLDSLIGGLDFLNQNPKKKVLFVSHYDPQMHGPKSDQEGLVKELLKIYSKQFEYIPSIKIYLESTNAHRETTFRSRSILFIGLALIAAQATNTQDIIIPENGTVSLNYPLSSSRRSSCSTRTTHPFVLDTILEIWKKLSILTVIRNPYEFQTKGEMVNNCKDQINLTKLSIISNSCGKRGHRAHWKNKNATHCGICMPCVYRQVALLIIGDQTIYGNSINNLFPSVKKYKKAQDMAAMLDFLGNQISKEDIKQELIVNGIKNLSKLSNYVNVVCRTRDELKEWIRKVGNNNVKSKAGI
ncbi:MAG: hypothetical protein MUC49_21360 [Raineya sp.]|jgi:7-cyano-7-deazaguanine synthase in queuosine biosynthesis|nr:hypothetical protein [Raineya sp.]